MYEAAHTEALLLEADYTPTCAALAAAWLGTPTPTPNPNPNPNANQVRRARRGWRRLTEQWPHLLRRRDAPAGYPPSIGRPLPPTLTPTLPPPPPPPLILTRARTLTLTLALTLIN